MKHDYVQCLGSSGFHRMHYTDRGDPGNPRVVVCVHGLTRTARDFDMLADELAGDFRVVCPDIAGRGESDWLKNKSDYSYPQYMADITTLLARVTANGASTLYWVGTSMGGMLGMLLAARPGSPITRLVLNDIGMFIPQAAMERLALYVGKDPKFPTLDALDAYVRFVSAPFGPLTDDQWRHVTVHNAKEHPDGSWGMKYDPAIGLPFQKGPLKDVDLTAVYDAVTCPTLLLRGGNSDLLLKETAVDMTQRGPCARLVEFPGTGHAPMLMSREQIGVVAEFLRG